MKVSAGWLSGIAVALLGACATAPAKVAPPPTVAPAPAPPPTADEDGTPQSPRPLALGAPHVDTLEREAGDLDDWYRLDVPSAGTLRVVVEGEGGAPLRGLFVALTDLGGQFPGNPTRSGGRARVELQPQVAAGPRLLWIGSEAGTSDRVAYTVRAEHKAARGRAPHGREASGAARGRDLHHARGGVRPRAGGQAVRHDRGGREGRPRQRDEGSAPRGRPRDRRVRGRGRLPGREPHRDPGRARRSHHGPDGRRGGRAEVTDHPNARPLGGSSAAPRWLSGLTRAVGSP